MSETTTCKRMSTSVVLFSFMIGISLWEALLLFPFVIGTLRLLEEILNHIFNILSKGPLLNLNMGQV